MGASVYVVSLGGCSPVGASVYVVSPVVAVA